MTIETIRNLRGRNTGKVRRYLQERFGSSAHKAAYVLAKAGATADCSLSSLAEFTASCNIGNTEIPLILQDLQAHWAYLPEAAAAFSAEDYTAYLLFDRTAPTRAMQTETPECLNALAFQLLDIQPTDTVGDLCTGKGAFLCNTFLQEPSASYYGNEIHGDPRAVAVLRSDLLSSNIQITDTDTLKLRKNFDKIFSNFPLGIKRKDLDIRCKDASSADWLFAEQLVRSLTPNGKAVAILTNGSTWNLCDKEMRKAFIEQGHVETIIALPKGLFTYTAIGTVMMVFSHGNKTVTFMDASHLFEKGRRTNTLSQQHIAEICNCIKRESRVCKTVPISEIRKTNYELYPAAYLSEQKVSAPTVKTVPFSQLITRITRGSQIKAEELDAMASDTPTNQRFLRLSDIQNGIIGTELTSMTQIAPKYDKYCLKNGNLILSKNGLPIKIAVAEIPEDQKVLANGNLYIIELNTAKVEPYYLKAYLESEAGDAALRSICVGVSIPNIPVEALKALMIPLPNTEKQKEIAAAYRKKQQELIELRQQLLRAEAALRQIWEDYT